MIPYLFLIAAVTLTALGQVLYKLYFNKNNIWYLVFAIASFVFVPYSNYRALETISLDTVYTMPSITITLVLIASVFILNEKLNSRQIAGSMLIILGIIIYNL